jgi:hypothetical protein
MKTKARPLAYFSTNPLKSVSNEPLAEVKQDTRSPYLRAILSASNSTINSLGASSTDRDAATRYIRESKMLHKK